MNDRPQDPGELVRTTWDILSIMKTLAKLAHAQDDLDRETLKTCFDDRVLLKSATFSSDWEAKEITADELADFMFASLVRYDARNHLVLNHVIDLDGDEAACEADLYGVAVMIEEGVTTTSFLGGRYSLRLRRKNEAWVIFERSLDARYRGGDPTLAARATARAEARKRDTSGPAS